MTIQEAATALRARKVSSFELTSKALEGIARLDPKFNTFITVMEESARNRAHDADAELSRGIDRGPLHGIPVAVKDVFATKGIRTTCGSKLFVDHTPDHDSAVVERLSVSGAVLIGKTNMHELAYGITSANPHFGPVRNPWDIERIPGGSSGGSGAAVAADFVFMAMGSDTGGSIRIPASFCGTVGLKPTFGRVSRYGVLPLDFSLDHMGPLTRSVRDAALSLEVLAGFDPRDDTSSHHAVDNYLPGQHPSIRDVRIGVPDNFYFDQVDPAVVQAVQRMAEAAESLGARVVSLRVPDIPALNAVGRVILLCEAAALMQPYLHRRQDFGADVLALLDQGRLLPATDYVNAQRLRRMMKQEFQNIWKQVDCLFVPTTPTSAPKIGQATIRFGEMKEDARLASTRLVRGINVLGLPALSMPSGWDDLGLPIGLQIIAPPFRESLILRAGAALEDSTNFRHRLPKGIE
jgi:aspartyl-tRNA(Asn)/glutamyl-tRNA(Gln) amidotransferase subunit A